MITSINIIARFTACITSQPAAQRLQPAVRAFGDLAIVRTGAVLSTSGMGYLKNQHIDARG